MQEQTLNSETNTQEQQFVKLPKKRGRPPRNPSIQSTSQIEVTPIDNPEVEQLKQQLQQLQEENLKLKQIAETITITNTKSLINCTDDEINSLYIGYISKHETAHENALVIETGGKVIIPKSYYVVG
ncbi:MAG: hypothetical protein PHT02_00595 [Tissierellia bacterium]|nr:hypothetical protein [Tissierellia bacterium]